MIIQSPIAWLGDQLNRARVSVGSSPLDEYWPAEAARAANPRVRRIGLNDVGVALAKGLDDFAANRTDVLFLCLIYPVVGLLLASLASGYGVVPLLFPLASGFALIGPLAAIGLNEMSRRRETGAEVSWVDALSVLRAPSIGAIAGLGLLLVAIFLLWLVTAQAIYDLTLGPKPPVSFTRFAHDVVATGRGWMMIIAGVAVGFLFALLVLSISVVSFPMLLDHNVRLETALRTSIQAVRENKRTMAVWGLIVAAALAIGSVPLLLGLIVVMPVLGHATWHLYRRVIAT